MGTQEEKIFPASRSQIMNLKVALSLPDSCEISNTIYEEASWFFNLTVEWIVGYCFTPVLLVLPLF